MSSNVTTGLNATCPGCGAVLVTEGLGPDQAVLCPACCATFLLRRPGFALRTSRLAIASLVLGILSLLGMCLTGIPAIITGLLALREIHRSKGGIVGRRLAIGGIATGGVLGFLCAPVTLALMAPLAQQFKHAPPDVSQAAEQEPEKALGLPDSQTQMGAMRRIAGGLTVMTIDDAPRDAQFIPEPLFQSFAPARDAQNVSVWGYGGNGRPAALLSLSLVPSPKGAQARWMYELNSLSTRPVEAKIPGAKNWSTRQSGLEFKALSDAPDPAEMEDDRTQQLHDLSARFTGFESFPDKGRDGPLERFKLRFIPEPIHRYRDPGRGQVDGAIFLLTRGTNPEVVLVIELVRDSLKNTSWRYALTRLSFAQLHIELDGTDVWTQPQLQGTTAADPYWLFSTPVPAGTFDPQ
jgi:hypothetical protein